MDLIIIGITLCAVVYLYFANNPLAHKPWFMVRRFISWFPLGMTYAFLYMGRYNLNVSKNALGTHMSKENFGLIFAAGTITYAVSFLINGPLVDKIGGKRGIIIAAIGSSLMNILMGVVTYLYLNGHSEINLLVVFSILYSLNMYFQSYGAVSINKVKAYWFHVRERGIFGAIFGTLISFGVYFAFDWGQAIVEATKANVGSDMTVFQKFIHMMVGANNTGVDATWFVFFIPGILLIFWAIIDSWLIKNTPEDAGFESFDTADGSSGNMDREYTTWDLIKMVFTSPVMLTIAFIDLTSGVIRNGIMQWYFIFAKEVPTGGNAFILKNWGLLLCMSGIFGSFAGGVLSDKLFQSRRGPPAAIMSGLMVILTITMAIFLFSSPLTVGICAILIGFAVIAVHGLMSGTAASDFGGRKATATCSGIVDGFVYVGTGIQSFSLGYLTSLNWRYWPLFLVPFAIIGLLLGLKIWRAIPDATKKYIKEQEKQAVEF